MLINLLNSRLAAASLSFVLLATAVQAEESSTLSADPNAAKQSTSDATANSISSGQDTSNRNTTENKNDADSAPEPVNSKVEQSNNSPSSALPNDIANQQANKPETKPELKTTPAHLQAEPHKASTEPRQASSQPTKLYGRIEELCAGTGAKIPLKMQAMTPIRDASLDQKTLKGQTATQSFPIDYRGTWSGELTVYTANFDRSYWEFDRAEADKESQLLRPGTRGRCTVTFYQGANNRTELQPCEVVFTTTVNASQEMKQLMGGASPFGALFGGANNLMMANMQVPYMYALHLGNLTSGTGVTGNQLNSQLMKNTLKELARGVLEQEVVTRDMDRNPSTGKVKTGYSESVLRFTRMSNNRLYLQAASVSYRSDGKYQNKVILYGTLDRSNGSPSYGNPYGAAQSNPFGGMMPGAGGAGALQQEFQQMQKLMQQMGGQ